jgi:hypothetical protein
MAWTLTAIKDANLDNIYNEYNTLNDLRDIHAGETVTCSDDEYLSLERAGYIVGSTLAKPDLECWTAVYVGGSGGGGGEGPDPIITNALSYDPATGKLLSIVGNSAQKESNTVVISTSVDENRFILNDKNPQGAKEFYFDSNVGENVYTARMSASGFTIANSKDSLQADYQGLTVTNFDDSISRRISGNSLSTSNLNDVIAGRDLDPTKFAITGGKVTIIGGGGGGLEPDEVILNSTLPQEKQFYLSSGIHGHDAMTITAANIEAYNSDTGGHRILDTNKILSLTRNQVISTNDLHPDYFEVVLDKIVTVGGGGGGIPEAPTDGGLYGRINSNWERSVPEAAFYGEGPLTVAGYILNNGSAVTLTVNNAATDLSSTLTVVDEKITLASNDGPSYTKIQTGPDGPKLIVYTPLTSETFSLHLNMYGRLTLEKDAGAAHASQYIMLDTPVRGGTTGQVLAKASNSDLDFAWVDASGGGSGRPDSELILNSTNSQGPKQFKLGVDDSFVLVNDTLVRVQDHVVSKTFSPEPIFSITDRLVPCVADFHSDDFTVDVSGKIRVTNSGGGGGIPEAPLDGKTYGRKDAGWVELAGGGGGLVGDDVILNSTSNQGNKRFNIGTSNLDTLVMPGFVNVAGLTTTRSLNGDLLNQISEHTVIAGSDLDSSVFTVNANHKVTLVQGQQFDPNQVILNGSDHQDKRFTLHDVNNYVMAVDAMMVVSIWPGANGKERWFDGRKLTGLSTARVIAGDDLGSGFVFNSSNSKIDVNLGAVIQSTTTPQVDKRFRLSNSAQNGWADVSKDSVILHAENSGDEIYESSISGYGVQVSLTDNQGTKTRLLSSGHISDSPHTVISVNDLDSSYFTVVNDKVRTMGSTSPSDVVLNSTTNQVGKRFTLGASNFLAIADGSGFAVLDQNSGKVRGIGAYPLDQGSPTAVLSLEDFDSNMFFVDNNTHKLKITASGSGTFPPSPVSDNGNNTFLTYLPEEFEVGNSRYVGEASQEDANLLLKDGHVLLSSLLTDRGIAASLSLSHGDTILRSEANEGWSTLSMGAKDFVLSNDRRVTEEDTLTSSIIADPDNKQLELKVNMNMPSIGEDTYGRISLTETGCVIETANSTSTHAMLRVSTSNVYVQTDTMDTPSPVLTEATMAGVLGGGSQDQVLTKKSAANFDFGWTTKSDGAVIYSATSPANGQPEHSMSNIMIPLNTPTAFDLKTNRSLKAGDFIFINYNDGYVGFGIMLQDWVNTQNANPIFLLNLGTGQ